MIARREGRAAPARARDRLPDLVAGAVRPRDDRVDGLRDAGDRDPLGRRARGDRATGARGSSSTTGARRPARSRRPTRSTPPCCGASSRSASRPSAWSPTTSPPTKPRSLAFVEAPLPVRPRDPQARRAGARRARGRAALRPRRHGDRRPPRPAAARRARDRRDGAHRALRGLQLPPVRDDGAGRARVRRGRGADREPARRAGALALARLRRRDRRPA